MRLVLSVRGVLLTFDAQTAEDSDAPYPWLTGVGTLRESALGGDDSAFGAGATPSLRVQLDNSGRQLTRIVGLPLREPAEVFDDDGASFFAGLVSNVELGPTVTLELGT